MEPSHALVVNSEEALCRSLFAAFVLQIPHAIPVSEFFVLRPAFRQDSALKTAHVEQQVGVILGVHTDKAVLPLDSGHRSRQTVLDVPEHRPSQVNVVFHQSHPGIPWPAFLVVVANDVFVVRIWMFCEVSLYEFSGFLCSESEKQTAISLKNAKVCLI